METNEEITLTMQLNQDLPYVLGDSEKLRRVLINLIGNAQQAMPEGGELSISGSHTGGTVELSFSDSGVGISEEQLKKIFDPLFTTKPNGTGLGLSICHQIISQHNGRIDVSKVIFIGKTCAKDDEGSFTTPVKPDEVLNLVRSITTALA